jgi:hypothetical protein
VKTQDPPSAHRHAGPIDIILTHDARYAREQKELHLLDIR